MVFFIFFIFYFFFKFRIKRKIKKKKGGTTKKGFNSQIETNPPLPLSPREREWAGLRLEREKERQRERATEFTSGEESRHPCSLCEPCRPCSRSRRPWLNRWWVCHENFEDRGGYGFVYDFALNIGLWFCFINLFIDLNFVISFFDLASLRKLYVNHECKYIPFIKLFFYTNMWRFWHLMRYFAIVQENM